MEFSNFNVQLMDRKMRRMCGAKSSSARHAVTSDGNFFRVTFKSNDAYDATGFTALYQFRKYEGPSTAGVVAAVAVLRWGQGSQAPKSCPGPQNF